MQIAQDTATSQENSIMPERVLRDLVVERRQVDRLIPYIRNARTHAEEQVAQVAASIAEFGFVNPILVGADGVIIAGHARLAAARKLGMIEVPVIVLDHLSETQRRALVLADNRLALNAGWDEEMLQVELQTLQEEGFDLDIVGFTDEEIEGLLQDPEAAASGQTDEDAVPETPETAVTVPGDVWVLGDHRLLCGDATQMTDVEKVLAGGLADMVFCDPPYGVNYGATMKSSAPPTAVALSTPASLSSLRIPAPPRNNSATVSVLAADTTAWLRPPASICGRVTFTSVTLQVGQSLAITASYAVTSGPKTG